MGIFLSQYEGIDVQLGIRVATMPNGKIQNGVKAHFLNILYPFVSSATHSGVNLTDLLSAVEQILQEGATPSVTRTPVLLGWAHDGCGRKTYLTAPLCQPSYY